MTAFAEPTGAAGSSGTRPRYDVVVVGGGAAGLSGALTLVRARRSVLVVDSGRPRNAPAGHVHGFLTQDGVPPAQLLAAGRDEVARYGGEFVQGTAASAERLDSGGFRVTLDDASTVVAARLLVATGLVDELPDVPGVAERWGRDVLHCPYCHGWEVRDRAIGVLATGPLAAQQALVWRQWSKDVTLFLHTGPEPGDEEYEQLAAREIAVVDGRVTGLDVAAGDTDGRLRGVRLEGGRVVGCAALVVAPRFTARAGVLAGLGLEAVQQRRNGAVIGSCVPADESGATDVPGVWVAGNVTAGLDKVVGAAAAGVRAAVAINIDLISEETRREVVARRSPFSPQAEREVCERVLGERRHGLSAPQPGSSSHRHSTEEHPPMIEGHEGSAEFWDARYRESERIWSGNPNVALVREVTGLRPGTALDLGCGEGADAIWLAQRGWRVTATDVSAVALERAARHAEESGVADAIEWRRQDLAVSFPDGEFDLVSAHYLHSPGDLPREGILRSAASAVAPGGVLLVVGHAGPASWERAAHEGVPLPTPQEVLESLELSADGWEVQRCEEFERLQNDFQGRPGTRNDNVLRLRRLPG
ncbi:NAD(P)/FAD-dependent oxidoreductase [Streptomyces sp. ISL-10]|uniref:FAD-dependent oxidoreductase n=1 Tax=Streptomyces sp. ISL-10 TaxID=2819172 RepID=UPI001BEC1623|nr:FAD-dependent oxidoreductase [Streptomyces sp. ISL-10]MBT2365989.1 NAD(P)/FAD-dependent oxidoreductase [Streptomyces sp. ISL-10]